MKKILSVSMIAFLMAVSVFALEQPNYELPVNPGNGAIINHTEYTICYNPQNYDPIWCAEQLTNEMTIGNSTRAPEFKPDPKYTSSAKDSEYVNSGFDRGHQVPAEDMAFNQNDMNETFYTTNIVPQNKTMNEQNWKMLEIQVRKWTSDFDMLYIATGPVFDKDAVPAYIGSDIKIQVPNAMFKVILTFDKTSKEPQTIGFIMENVTPANTKAHPITYVVSVNDVEARAGLKFFDAADLTDAQKNDKDTTKWPWASTSAIATQLALEAAK